MGKGRQRNWVIDLKFGQLGFQRSGSRLNNRDDIDLPRKVKIELQSHVCHLQARYLEEK